MLLFQNSICALSKNFYAKTVISSTNTCSSSVKNCGNNVVDYDPSGASFWHCNSKSDCSLTFEYIHTTTYTTYYRCVRAHTRACVHTCCIHTRRTCRTRTCRT